MENRLQVNFQYERKGTAYSWKNGGDTIEAGFPIGEGGTAAVHQAIPQRCPVSTMTVAAGLRTLSN